MVRTMVVVLLVLLAGCAQQEPAPSEQFDPELGVGPVITEDEPTPLATPSPAPGAASPEPGSRPASTPSPIAEGETPASPGPTSQDSPAPAASPAPPASSPAPEPGEDAEPVVLLAVGDRTGDHGLQGPDWADLTSVEFVELGNDLRVTLRFDARVPSSPPEGQVPLINVDIGEGDGAYQLHVGSDGTGDGWAAYLHTPQGLVQYPGTFELAGSAIVLQVPFNTIGSPTRAPVRVLVEWSEDRTLVNASSADRLDGQPHTFDRNP